MPFRKRRRPKTVNKNEAKVRRAQAASDVAPLHAFYPGVERLWIGLDFYSPEGHHLSHEDRQFGPGDAADFSAPCPGRCGDGRMDLEGKVEEMVRREETESEGRARCPRTVYAGVNDLCGCELRARVRIAYRP